MTSQARDEMIRLRQALARECMDKAIAALHTPHYWLWVGEARAHELRAAELQLERAAC